MAATQTLPRSYGGRVPSEHQIFVLVRMRLEAYGGVARELLRTANKMLVPWRDSFSLSIIFHSLRTSGRCEQEV